MVIAKGHIINHQDLEYPMNEDDWTLVGYAFMFLDVYVYIV